MATQKEEGRKKKKKNKQPKKKIIKSSVEQSDHRVEQTSYPDMFDRQVLGRAKKKY